MQTRSSESGTPQGSLSPASVPTKSEAVLLQEDEVTDEQISYGIAANVLVGFGIGQALEGRWSDTGWIFTLGMGVSAVVLGDGLSSLIQNAGCDCEYRDAGRGSIYAGTIGLAAFYVAGIVDAYVGARIHNRKLRELRMRLGTPPKILPYVKKSRDGGGTAGLTFRF